VRSETKEILLSLFSLRPSDIHSVSLLFRTSIGSKLWLNSWLLYSF